MRMHAQANEGGLFLPRHAYYGDEEGAKEEETALGKDEVSCLLEQTEQIEQGVSVQSFAFSSRW